MNVLMKYSNKNKELKKFAKHKLVEPELYPYLMKNGGGIAIDGQDNLYHVKAYDYTVSKYDINCKLVGEYNINITNNDLYVPPPLFSNNMSRSEELKWVRSWSSLLDVTYFNNYIAVRYLSKDRKQYLDVFNVGTNNFSYEKTIEFDNLGYYFAKDEYLYMISPNPVQINENVTLNPSIYKYRLKE